MEPSNEVTVDQLMAAELSGREKLRTLIVARAGSVQAWARARSMYPEQVHMALSGARTYAEVRDALAEDLGLSRDDIDALIDVSAAEGAA